MSVPYFAPVSVAEALQLLADNGNYTLLAGGTDLVPRMNLKQVKNLRGLVYLGNITEMKRIVEHNDYIFTGALATHNQIATSELIKEKAPNVWYASYHMGTPAIRNAGTIGGNLVNASPTGDGCVALLAADARVVLKSIKENRLVAIGEFFVDKGRTALNPGEILYGVQLPKVGQGRRKGSSYQRIGLLKGSSTAITNVAAEVEQDGTGICQACRIAVGAMASTPIRLAVLEEALLGKKLDRELISQAVKDVDAWIKPIDDTYATAWYRRKAIKVLLKRALLEASGLAVAEGEV